VAKEAKSKDDIVDVGQFTTSKILNQFRKKIDAQLFQLPKSETLFP